MHGDDTYAAEMDRFGTIIRESHGRLYTAIAPGSTVGTCAADIHNAYDCARVLSAISYAIDSGMAQTVCHTVRLLGKKRRMRTIFRPLQGQSRVMALSRGIDARPIISDDKILVALTPDGIITDITYGPNIDTPLGYAPVGHHFMEWIDYKYRMDVLESFFHAVNTETDVIVTYAPLCSAGDSAPRSGRLFCRDGTVYFLGALIEGSKAASK